MGFENIGTKSPVKPSSLVSLGADEVQESVNFSSREKLTVCKVVEGSVRLSPGRVPRIARLPIWSTFIGGEYDFHCGPLTASPICLAAIHKHGH